MKKNSLMNGLFGEVARFFEQQPEHGGLQIEQASETGQGEMTGVAKY